MSDTFWTEEREAALIRLWDDGACAREVARTLGAASRSAICGKVARLRQEGRITRPMETARTRGASVRAGMRAVGRARAVAPPKPAKPRLIVLGHGAVAVASEPAPPRVPFNQPAFEPLPGSTPKPWTERAFGECAWPVGGDGDAMLSCCNPVAARGWCSQHDAAERDRARRQHKKPIQTPSELARSLRRYVA